MSIPVINIQPLCHQQSQSSKVEIKRAVVEIGKACQSPGFFYISGWESLVSKDNMVRLERLSHTFFQREHDEKMSISMKRSGLHWKGYFPSGDELTSGAPDAKEGLYFGEEYALDSPQVLKRLAMHGPNQFPKEDEILWRDTVTQYMNELTTLGLCVMKGIALSLGLPSNYFEVEFCHPKPFTPFRIFKYPGGDSRQGVGRHTDYGCLTILKQDDVGGLEVESSDGTWIPAPPIPDTFVVNIGDMLEIWTGGRYRATPHRVVTNLPRPRMSMPFFFDPAFNAVIDSKSMRSGSLVLRNAAGEEDVVVIDQTIKYGEYITHKVAHVFPELFSTSGGQDRLSSSKL